MQIEWISSCSNINCDAYIARDRTINKNLRNKPSCVETSSMK